MLSRFRKRFQGFVDTISLPFISLSPNAITLIGFASSVGVLLFSYLRRPTFSLLMVILAAYFDVVDGAVARRSGRVSRRGAFLDSFTDRLSDVLISTSLYYLGVGPIEVIALISGTLLISYTRARAESLGGHKRLEGVGLMERAERLVSLTLIFLLLALGLGSAAYILLYVTILLVWATVVQRGVSYFLLLGGPPPS